jgi:putative ABC transport system substrate-binding protein
MRRRELIAGLGSVVAWPLGARAQQPAVPVIGYLGTGSPEAGEFIVALFRQGLKETGFIEGQNVEIVYRWDEGRYDRLPALAADLVRRRVAVIVATGAANAAQAAKQATTTIPIVFFLGSDPVELGLVTSLNRPGANVTGFTFVSRELLTKRLEILRELLPGALAFGLLVNPRNVNAETEARQMEVLARAGGWVLHTVPASTEADFDMAFATLVQLQVGGTLFATDILFVRYDQLVATAARYRVPALHSSRQFAEAGGLMSYGPRFNEVVPQVGVYAGRILKGEKPANLPVQYPTRYETVLNMKTAKALGLTVPQSILLRADEVIE